MTEKAKRIILLNPLHPRMLTIMRYLDSHGGEKQIDLASMSAAIGFPKNSVLRYTRWLELYGGLHVERTSNGFGVGRASNTYRMLMPLADYERDALHLREVVRRALKPKPVRTNQRRFPRTVPVIDPYEMASIRAQAKEEVALALQGDPLPAIDQAPLDYSDVEAWGAFNG